MRPLSCVGHYPVAPIALGTIERLIRPLQHELRGIIAKFERRYPDTCCDVQQTDLPSDLERTRGDALAKALTDLIGLGQVAVGHHYHELLAAKPAGEIDAARIAANSRGELPQHRVPGIVKTITCLAVSAN